VENDARVSQLRNGVARHTPQAELWRKLVAAGCPKHRRRSIPCLDERRSVRRLGGSRQYEGKDGKEEGRAGQGGSVTEASVRRVTRTFVGIGSNLGDREQLLNRAVDELRALPGTTVLAVSSFRDTAPVGITDQPRFLNGVVELETGLSAPALLDALLEIELALGRDRSGVPRGGPRTIDLDLLLFGDARIDRPGLEIPHPRLHERGFVLEPLAELDPALEVPGKGPVEGLIAKLHSAS